MEKKRYVTFELDLYPLEESDVITASLMMNDKFDDNWTPGTDDFVITA